MRAVSSEPGFCPVACLLLGVSECPDSRQRKYLYVLLFPFMFSPRVVNYAHTFLLSSPVAVGWSGCLASSLVTDCWLSVKTCSLKKKKKREKKGGGGGGGYEGIVQQ